MKPGEQITLSCCDYKCHQGVPAPWRCPGCGKVKKPPKSASSGKMGVVSEDGWDDYESVQMFPGCDCGHDATEHKAAWGDWRDFEGCGLCACEVEWEHT